jgi:hypothetical protein
MGYVLPAFRYLIKKLYELQCSNHVGVQYLLVSQGIALYYRISWGSVEELKPQDMYWQVTPQRRKGLKHVSQIIGRLVTARMQP